MGYHIVSLTLPYARDGLTRERAYQGIKRAGYTHVALYDRHPEGPVWSAGADEAQAQAAARQARDAGLQIDHKSHGSVTGDPGSAEQFVRAIHLAGSAEVPALVCWGPYEYTDGGFPDRPKTGPAWQVEVDRFYRSFEQGVRAAEAAGVLLLPKPHTGVGKHGRALRQLHERFAGVAVAVAYDTGNVHYYEGIDPVDDIPHVADICRQVIMKDHIGPRGFPAFRTPGDGDIDLQGVLPPLAAAAFEGSLVVERVDVTGGERIDAELKRARNHLEAIARAAFGDRDV